jgi:hypothetical protein
LNQSSTDRHRPIDRCKRLSAAPSHVTIKAYFEKRHRGRNYRKSNRKGGVGMAVAVFDEQSLLPNNETVENIMASSFSVWDEFQTYLQEICPAVSHEWKFYSQKAGWSLQFRDGKHSLFYFQPYMGFFILTFVFGEKAVAAIEAGGLPDKILDAVHTATKFIEGRNIRLEIRNRDDLENIKKLLKIKSEN